MRAAVEVDERNEKKLSLLLSSPLRLDQDDRRVDREALGRHRRAHGADSDADGRDVDGRRGERDARDGVAVFFFFLLWVKISKLEKKKKKPETETEKKRKNSRDQARREVDGLGRQAHARDGPGDERGAVGEPGRRGDVLA